MSGHLTARQAVALAHPITDPRDLLAPEKWRAVDEQRDGNLLMTILAIDR